MSSAAKFSRLPANLSSPVGEGTEHGDNCDDIPTSKSIHSPPGKTTVPRRRSGYAIVSNEVSNASATYLSRRRSSQFRKSNNHMGPLEIMFDEQDVQDSELNETPDSSPPVPPTAIKLADYVRIMRLYPKYQAYIFSHFCMNMGDWFVRIASLLVVEDLDPNSGSTMATLVLSNLIPRTIFSQLGGMLSDNFDRRLLMVAIDLSSAIVVLGYLFALHYKSVEVLFLVTSVRSALNAMYFPATTAIVPMLIPDTRDLQLAVTLNSWVWGTTSILGGLLAGNFSANIGLSTCYIVDSVTFLLSATIIYFGVQGQFKVVQTRNATDDQTQHMNHSSHGFISLFPQVLQYLYKCGFGLLVLQKASGSLVWGVEDIVGVEFSTVFDSDSGEEDKDASSWNMGLLFAFIGIGCSIGPLLVNFTTDGKRPHTLQRACLIGLAILTSAWFLIANAHDFETFLVFTLIRTMGTGIIWINSTLTLQTLSDPEFLGRVLAVEYTVSTLTEAMTASIAGTLQDAGFNRNQLPLFGGTMGVILVLFWGCYYTCGLGAFDIAIQMDKSREEGSEGPREGEFA